MLTPPKHWLARLLAPNASGRRDLMVFPGKEGLFRSGYCRAAGNRRSSPMSIIDATAMSGFARRTAETVSDFASVVHNLIMDVRDSYRPELHYMRGPGPKWRAKHQPRLQRHSGGPTHHLLSPPPLHNATYPTL